MFSRAALTVVVATVLEVLGLVLVVRAFGVAPVVAILVVSALIGGLMLRNQVSGLLSDGVAGIAGFSGAVGRRGLTDRGLLLLAGLLLVVPGLFTSALGALLVLPPVRGVVAGWARRRFPVSAVVHGGPVPASGRSPHRRDVVDVDVVAEDKPNSARYELN